MVKQRLGKWAQMVFPYGSEFPWDSTGQEEINTWLLRSGKYAAANKTVGANPNPYPNPNSNPNPNQP